MNRIATLTKALHSHYRLVTKNKTLPFRKTLTVELYGSTQSKRHELIDCLLKNNISSSSNTETLIDNNPWLKEHNLEIHQVHSDWNSFNFTSHPPTGDLLIILLDALTENHLLNNHNFIPPSIHQPTLILLNSTHPEFISQSLLPRLASHPPKILFNSNAAISGLCSVDSNPRSYDLICQSGLLELRKSILESINPKLAPHVECDPSPIKPVQLLTALSISEQALSDLTNQVLHLSQNATLGSERVYEYQLRFDHLSQLANQILFPKAPQPLHPPSLTSVLNKHIGFWSLAFNSDLVGCRALQTLDEVQLSQIEKNLIFQAGQMKMIKKQAEDLVTEIIQDPVIKQYQTKVMVNQIKQDQTKHEQLEYEEGFKGSGLMRLLAERRAQLTSAGGPVEMLQAQADKLVLCNLTSGLGLTVFSYFSYLGHHPSAELGALEPVVTNYMPVSGFLLVSLVWLSQSKWRRSVRRFVQDFCRWRASLDNDLQAHKQRMVAEILLKHPSGNAQTPDVKLLKDINLAITQSLHTLSLSAHPGTPNVLPDTDPATHPDAPTSLVKWVQMRHAEHAELQKNIKALFEDTSHNEEPK